MENKVSLFIPVYNDARLIKKDLRKSYNALLQLHKGFEIAIVHDNPTDKSYRFKHVIDKLKLATGKEIRYISYGKGPSRRENLAKSFYLAKHEIICFIDADFSCDISYLFKVIDLLKKGFADIVVAVAILKAQKQKDA